MKSIYVRSPLKWAGGKYRLLPQLLKYLPTGDRLIEPFLGSAVVFLNTRYKRYLLSDINSDLIDFYQTIQRDIAFIKEAKKIFHPKYNTEKQFYQLREKFNTIDTSIEKSVLFLYLNRHSYNGLCRYNNSGLFNTPFGSYAKPYFPEKELEYFHEKAQHAVFSCQPYEMVMNAATKSDVVYCDPPYVPLSKTANFTQYRGKHFEIAHQKELANIAAELTEKNIPVIISNHNTKFTREIYAPAKLIKFNVQRLISCTGHNRNLAKELLAIYTART